MNANSFFTSSYLRETRKDAKTLKVKLPTGIWTYKVGRGQYQVGANGERERFVTAYDANEAKSRFLQAVIQRTYPAYGECTAEEIVAGFMPVA